MNYVDMIEKTLQEYFQPDLLEVIDESELHRGHAGFEEGRQSHFRIVISANNFKTMSRVSRERAVHKALGAGIMHNIHALSIKFQ